MEGRTTILVTHRTSIIREDYHVMKIEDGRIVETTFGVEVMDKEKQTVK